MKTKEELVALKEEVDNLNDKLKELTPEELEQVTGGACRIKESVDGVKVAEGSFVDKRSECCRADVGQHANAQVMWSVTDKIR